MVRGDVPTEEIITNFPWWRKIIGKMMLKKMEGKFDLEEGYNLEAAKLIKPIIGEIPLIVVGGLRKVAQMEEVIGNGLVQVLLLRVLLDLVMLPIKKSDGNELLRICYM